MGATKKDIKIFIICLLTGGLFPLTIFGTEFYFKADQEVQLHDTYFIFRPYEFAIVIIGLILFFVFLIRAIRTRFKSKLTLTFLALGTIVLGLVVVQIYEMINS
jgi:uncharacterized membrane protein